ncbi:putative ORFan [Tupanvirus deep ocean]|uniref:ORFan n=2 Tax=Tupanvirus TaxID=2094720 RepID=A0AC62A925_9VIRU|nr:putative ORFan [Tupanvirus deep ocean]QKU34265.1 putative ORFan [Tupanvirus deep ocean]
MKPIYDPLEFIGKIELFTIAIIGSFITMKFLNAMYENIYEPMVDVIVDSEKTDNYYVKIGHYYVQMGMIVKEFIKWFLLIILLMIMYNMFINRIKQ